MLSQPEINAYDVYPSKLDEVQMKTIKQYKGYISNWYFVKYEEGYVIKGRVEDHPEFGQNIIRTSLVTSIKFGDVYLKCETLNSIYHLDVKTGPE